MPTVEDYVEEEEETQQPTDSFVFDDDTDLPLPGSTPAVPSSSRGKALPNTGTRGGILSHIDDDEVDFDLAKLQGQGRGIENVGAPAASARTGSSVTRSTDDSTNRPVAPPPQGQMGMGGIMGDLMKIQEAEEQRMRKLEKQLGSTRFVKDPEEFKR